MTSLRRFLPEAVSSRLTPKRRDALVFVLGLVLLLSPVLLTMGFLGGTEYRYASTEVVETGNALAYADASEVPDGTPISEEIACSGTLTERACGLERLLVDANPQPLDVTSENPSRDPAIAPSPYQFVQLDGEIYRAIYTTADDGSVSVALNSSSATVARQAVSLDPDRQDVPDTVMEAAESGEVTSRTAVDVPQTPVVTDDGYYRVYTVGEQEASGTPLSMGVFFTATLGAVLLLSLARNVRVRVRYVPNE